MDQVRNLEEECRILRAENARLQQECLKYRQQELMEHLLRGEFVSGQKIGADLHEVGIDLTKDSYIELYVNVLMLPPAPEGLPDDTGLPPVDFKAIYEDGISGLIRQCYPDSFAVSARYGSGIVAILQMERVSGALPEQMDPGNFIDSLNTKALELADTLSRDHGIEAFVAISRPHHGVDSIPDAHQEILEINNYRAVMGIDVPVLCYHDFEMAEADNNSDYTMLRMEQQYLSSVELGEYEQARQILQNMIDQEFRHAVPSLFSLRYKLSAKLGLLLITLEKFQEKEQAEVFDEVFHLQKSLTQEDLTLEDLRAKIDLIFTHIKAYTEQQRNPKWMNTLLSYVDENYTRPDLNVASISVAFQLNPSYLTREVKRCTGSSLLDLLQKKRLDHAIALIDGGASMAQAAEQSGFGDIRSMRRAFQKYVQATPQLYFDERRRAAQ